MALQLCGEELSFPGRSSTLQPIPGLEFLKVRGQYLYVKGMYLFQALNLSWFQKISQKNVERLFNEVFKQVKRSCELFTLSKMDHLS